GAERNGTHREILLAGELARQKREDASDLGARHREAQQQRFLRLTGEQKRAGAPFDARVEREAALAVLTVAVVGEPSPEAFLEGLAARPHTGFVELDLFRGSSQKRESMEQPGAGRRGAARRARESGRATVRARTDADCRPGLPVVRCR